MSALQRNGLSPKLRELRTLLISFFVANEALSVVENVGLMGVKIPPRLMKAIDVLKSKSEDGDKPDDT